MAKPVGADLTTQQLVDALMYRVKAKSKKYSTSHIEQIERRLQTLTAFLRGIRNSQSPVNRLPPELLALIFKECQQHLSSFLPCPPEYASMEPIVSPMAMGPPHYRPGHAIRQRPSPQAEWLMLSNVCRNWRGVIASFPILWSSIDQGFHPEMFLRRSRDIPIKVYMGLTPSAPSFSLTHIDMIVSHIYRLKELHLCMSDWHTIASDVFQRLNRPANQLESLTIDSVGSNPLPTLPAIFDGCMPRLRKLALTWYTSWPRKYFHHLTHLCLQNQSMEMRPTTEDFLSFIEESPDLQVLALVAAGPTRTPADDVPGPLPERLVHLLHLKELVWGSVVDVMTVRRLLEHLSLPDSVHLYFWGSPIVEAHTSEDISDILPIDKTHLPSLLQIREWRCSRTPPVAGFPQNIVAFVGSIMYLTGPFYASQMEKVADTFPVGDVHTFFVEDAFSGGGNGPVAQMSPFLPAYSSMSWKPVFARMGKLRYLAIGGSRNAVAGSVGRSPTRMILSALYPPENGEVLCKGLRTIAVHDDVGIPAFYVSALAEERARRHCPILKLEVRAYRMSLLRRVHSMSSASHSVTSASDSEDDGDPGRDRGNVAGLEEEDVKVLKRYIQDVDVLCLKLPRGHSKPIEMMPPGFATHPIYVWTSVFPVGR